MNITKTALILGVAASLAFAGVAGAQERTPTLFDSVVKPRVEADRSGSNSGSELDDRDGDNGEIRKEEERNRIELQKQAIDEDAPDAVRIQARENVEARLDGRPEAAEDRISDENRGRLSDEERELKKEEAEKERLAREEERKTQILEKRIERIKAYLVRTIARLDAAVERLSKLADRVDSRILKFEERGINMTEARRLFAEAEAAIGVAEEAVLSIGIDTDEVASTLTGSDDPRTIFENIRASIKEAVEAIRGAHAAIVDTIVAIKAALPDQAEQGSDDESNGGEDDGDDSDGSSDDQGDSDDSSDSTEN